MTTPDPRTDLAGYLGLTDEQARICRQSAEGGYTGIRGKVGARLIEQDQARDAEPDDGLIPVTVRLTAEEVRARANADYEVPEVLNERPYTHAAVKFGDACRAIDLPAPKPPWKSPLADLPDLTEEQCDYLAKLAAGYPCDVNDSVLVLVGRALIAAGWTPEEEA